MKRPFWRCCFLLISTTLPTSLSAQQAPRVVHVFVALADNAHQGIVPVPAALGNGDDPNRNLYWGAAFGVRTFFSKSKDWMPLGLPSPLNKQVIQRQTFRHTATGTLLIADAYRGSEIKKALEDFFAAAAGQQNTVTFIIEDREQKRTMTAQADLVVYVGHDGLMDFSMDKSFRGGETPKRQAIVLACASKQYFGSALKPTGAEPLLWTTNLMAPEAYTLKAALDGWMAGESNEQIRERAAAAYGKYQKISEKAAMRLFATGW